MQEPKDGDFVAYVEALQRESAARLARAHASPGESPFPAPASRAAPGSAPAPAPTPMPGPGHGSARRDRDARLVRALVAGVVGLAFLLSWLGHGGPFAFIVGVALLAYALPRLISSFRRPDRPATNEALVDHVFGRSKTPGQGTRK